MKFKVNRIEPNQIIFTSFRNEKVYIFEYSWSLEDGWTVEDHLQVKDQFLDEQDRKKLSKSNIIGWEFGEKYLVLSEKQICRPALEFYDDEGYILRYPKPVDELDDYLNLAIEQYQKGYWSVSRIVFERIKAKAPFCFSAYLYLTRIAWDYENFELAMDIAAEGYQKGLSLLPETFKGQLPWRIAENQPFLRLGQANALCQYKAGNYGDAIDVLEQLICLDPQDCLGAAEMIEDMRASHPS